MMNPKDMDAYFKAVYQHASKPLPSVKEVLKDFEVTYIDPEFLKALAPEHEQEDGKCKPDCHACHLAVAAAHGAR